MVNPDTIAQIDELIITAAGDTKMPEQVVSGFDGDAWRWIWRDETDAGQFAEVHLRISNDVITQELHAELQSVTWTIRDPSVARSMPVTTLPVFAAHLQQYLDGTEPMEPARTQLAHSLQGSWSSIIKLSGEIRRYDERSNEDEQHLDSIIKSAQHDRTDSIE